MPYHISTYVSFNTLEEVKEKITLKLREVGFGVLTEIDLQATFKAKLDLDREPYVILGACNPKFASQAIEAESHIGVFLPCNVIIQKRGENNFEVSAVSPIASMQSVDNSALGEMVQEIEQILSGVISAL